MADSADPAPPPPPTRNPLKRLYFWVLTWADHKHGTVALFSLSFAESIFFPIPPDVLMIALILGRRKKAWMYALVCTVGSLMGAAIGYHIGVALSGATEGFWYTVFGGDAWKGALMVWKDRGGLFVFSAAFSPIPYKVFTIAAGAFDFDFQGFMLASLVGRGGRFFLVAAVFYWVGERAKPFIEKWFNWLALLFVVLLLLGFWFIYRLGCGDSPSEPADAARIRPQVEKSTGWRFKSVPAYRRIDRQELLRHLEDKLEGEPGRRVAALGRALQTMEVLPADYSLLEGLKKAYAEEILALYDIKERKVFLVREALDRTHTAEQKLLRDVTLAHEMVHALQHQHDPKLDLVESEDPDLDDVRVALHAFVEGEATIHGSAVLGLPYQQLSEQLERGARGKYAGEPPILRRALYFPYIAGTRHVAAKVAGGLTGTAARLHGQIPLSTEHLLHGRKAANDPPVAVFLPDLSETVGGGRRLAYEGVLGEAYLVPVLGGGEPQRTAPASAFVEKVRWGGDRLQLYEKDDGSARVVVVLTIWDDFESTEILLKRLEGKRLRAFRKGRTVAIVAGPSSEKAAEIGRAALQRGVTRPFRSVEELRKLRAEFSGK